MLSEQKNQAAEGVNLAVNSTADILCAREKARQVASELGFSSTDLTFIATAISALARNIVRFAKRGQISVHSVRDTSRCGIMIVATDEGPGMPDYVMAGTDSAEHVGLRGVRRFMDEVHIDTAPGKGTTITARKWVG